MNKKLNLIRKAMSEKGIAAYIIPITDPHLGEYVPEHWRIIAWLSGFTGSAANVVITHDFAGLWTDSRYFIQADEQLKDSGFDLVKLKIPHTPEYIDWLAENMSSGDKVAVDGRIIPIGIVKMIEKVFARKSIILDTDTDLIIDIWKERKPMPLDMAFEHEVRFAGKSRDNKIAEVRARMKEMQADYHLLTSLDDIAWLLNIRGNDVNYSPLFTSFAIIGQEYLALFADTKKIPQKIQNKLKEDGVTIFPYSEIAESIKQLKKGDSLLITPGTTSAALFQSIPEGVSVIDELSIPTRMKAVKNDIEREHIINVMLKDGIALTMFFYWLEKSVGKENITEISAADKLLEFRMQQADCTGPSFSTIAGYNEHAALPHYSSTPETDVELKPEGIFLLDSGGQYLNGTTDVTRTVCLGTPTKQQRTDFTLALKGTINLAMVKFPLGTKGYQIEVLARKALWDYGMNYGHGTGHGVGFFLNVHEGPQTIGTGASGDLKTVIEPGMLTADEPAIYRVGEYGFRTENLVLCVEDQETEYGKFLKFETVTLCYIDLNLIDKSLLTDKELNWLNSYHQKVFNALSSFLPDDEAAWLKTKTTSL